MHPAYSVIFFTTSSVAGYGLLFWLSLAHAAGLLPQDRWLPFAAITIALLLITAGLLSSTFHLGRPERAWRAFSQWRSSWLSREGVAAVAAYAPSGLLALVWLLGIETPVTFWLAILSAVGAVITVYCTGMIYASLATIRQWNIWLVPVNYLTLSAASGALLLALLLALSGETLQWPLALSMLSLLGAFLAKLTYYRTIDSGDGKYTAQMATGLEGPIRQLDPPHTRPNFVMREMGYEVGRRHAKRLRLIALLCLFVLPAILIPAASVAAALSPVLLLLAAIAAAIGLFVECWLFFAEAEHVAMLYYGKAKA